MSSRNLATVLLKVLGVIWLLTAVSYFLEIPSTMLLEGAGADGFKTAKLAEALILGILYLIAAIALVARTDSVIKLLAIPENEISTLKESDEIFASLGFGVVGLYLFVLGIVNLAQLLASYPEKVQYLAALSTNFKFRDFIKQNYLGIIADGLQIVLGILLCFGRNVSSRVWLKARGIPKVEEEK
jgi:hypothetical protein